MRGSTLVLALALAIGVVAWFQFQRPERPTAALASQSAESSPVSPWRDPPADLRLFFPTATNYVTDERILSGVMVAIEKRLGRPMNSDENPLRIFRAIGNGEKLGSILVYRTKGEHGAIELVMALETNGVVRSVRIQSQREPETVANVITNSNFLKAFNDKSASSPLRLAQDLPDVSGPARNSAQAIADAIRSELIVHSFAEQTEKAAANPAAGNGR